ncbi:MAG: restriction endonuclease subunit S [Candidatus Thiodiazotropha sp.]
MISIPQQFSLLGALADITMGQSPDSSSVNSEECGLPFLQGCSEFGLQSPEAELYCMPPLRVSQAESILISVRAPVGTMNWGDQSYCIGRGLAAIKAKQGLADTKFLSYSIYQNVDFLHRRSQGSTFLAISANDLNRFPIPVYSLAQQNKISWILQTIDKAIEKTEALIEKYQQIKAGLMHDLFTRGIGADGKLRPPREQAPELYQQTPIGWIPTEWDCVKIKGYVRSVQYGISISLDDLENGIPVLRMNNIQSNMFDVSDLKYTSDLEAYKIQLKKGDILYNRTNSMEHVGKTAMWRDELPESSFASYLVRINLYEDMILPEFFSHWMSQISSQNAIRRYATPAVQQVNINPTNLQKVFISCPKGIEEQQEISKRILITHEAQLLSLWCKHNGTY